MNLHAILTRLPINRLAARVVSQQGVFAEEVDLKREELAYIVQRLSRKQRLLKHILGIANHRQHKNMMLKANKRISQYRVVSEPRAFDEYRRLGREIMRLNEVLAEMRKARRAEYEAKHQKLVPNEQN